MSKQIVQPSDIDKWEYEIETNAVLIRGQSLTEVVELWNKVKPHFDQYEDVEILVVADHRGNCVE